MKVALYARCSTKNKGQDTENQMLQLRDYCLRNNLEIAKEYVDYISGGTNDRQAFQELFSDVKTKVVEFEIVIFWSLDRFSREGVRKTIQYLQELEDGGVGFKSFTEQYLESSGIFKDVIISLLATLARQEKIRCSERVMAGLEKAKQQGRIGGRPKLNSDLQNHILELKTSGKSNREISRQLHLAPSTIGIYVNCPGRA